MIKKIQILIFFLIPSLSMALVEIEPFFGKNLASSFKYKTSKPSDNFTQEGDLFKDDISNYYTFGNRTSLKFIGFFIGHEINFGQTTLQAKSPSGHVNKEQSTSSDLRIINNGIFLGYRFPLLFKIWSTYYLYSNWKDNTGTPDNLDNPPGDKFKGRAISIGTGFTGIPFVDINLEFKKYKLDRFQESNPSLSEKKNRDLDGTCDLQNDSCRHEISYYELFLSLSIPLEIY